MIFSHDSATVAAVIEEEEEEEEAAAAIASTAEMTSRFSRARTAGQLPPPPPHLANRNDRTSAIS